MSDSEPWESDDPVPDSPVKEAPKDNKKKATGPKTMRSKSKELKQEQQMAPDLTSVVKHRPPMNKDAISKNDIQIALSGSKLVFTGDGIWRDASDKIELMESVHPIIAENINLRRRAELLVRLVSESEYENQQIESEMKECDDIIKELKKLLGEEDENDDNQDEKASDAEF